MAFSDIILVHRRFYLRGFLVPSSRWALAAESVCTNVYLAARESWFLTYNASAHPLWVHRRNRGHSNQTRLQLTAVTCDCRLTLSMIHFKSLISIWLAGWILQRFRGVRAWLSVLTAHWKSTLLTAENPWKVGILAMGSCGLWESTSFDANHSLELLSHLVIFHFSHGTQKLTLGKSNSDHGYTLVRWSFL